MKLEIVSVEEPLLTFPKMICDVKLNPNLDKYVALNNMNKYSFNVVLGKPGSGKSSILYALFKNGGKNKIFKKIFENIILFMPENSRNSIADNIFDKLPEENKFNELTFDSLTQVEEKISNESKENYKSCIILDDVTAALKNNEIQQLLRKIIFNRRHNKTSIILLVQNFLSIPKDHRRMINNLICFKISKTESENIFNELFENKKAYLTEIMKNIYDEPHNFMILDTDSQRIFKNMNKEIVIHEEDED